MSGAHTVFGEEEHIKMRTESKTINIKGHLFRFKCCHVRSLIFEYLNLKPIWHWIFDFIELEHVHALHHIIVRITLFANINACDIRTPEQAFHNVQDFYSNQIELKFSDDASEIHRKTHTNLHSVLTMGFSNVYFSVDWIISSKTTENLFEI